MADFPGARLHVVSGKGGTGKTTVAAALALALAHGGRRVLPIEVGGIARVGPLKSQSDGVMAVLRSKVTVVHLVTVLEEMPVQETLDGFAELATLNLPLGGAIINMVRQPVLSPSDLKAAEDG